MSVDTISEDANIISRLQLAKALKEDDISSENPETSAIFLRQRNRTTKYGVQPPRGSFYIPRPMNLLVPPVLGNAEGLNKDNNFSTPSSQSNSQQFQQDRRPSQPQIYTSSPRNSIIMPEERRGSASKPATLLDVRDSILEVRQNLQNSIPFSTSSSQRTSIILQQNKSLPDTNGKLHGASKLSCVTNSRPNSVVLSPRPVSAYNNNSNSRPTSFYKSNKSDEEDEKKSKEVKSKEVKEVKKSDSSSSDDSNSAPKLPPIKSVANQSIILEKVEEEDDSSDESEDDDDDDDDDSSEDDTPLALKSTPKIKVAPPRITTRKGSGGRIEAWLEHVSGSPEGPPSRSSTPTHSPRSSTPTHSPRPSTPTHSPRPSTPTRSSTPTHSPTHSPRIRKTSEHSIHQYNSSPLSPHRTSSYVAEPIHDARSRRPKSAYVPDNLQAPKPDFNQPRKRSNSEFLPKVRTNSVYEQTPQVPPFPIGRVSPSPRQDSGYWAKDTLIALSDDLRHISLMNDSNSSHSSSSRGRSSSFSNINGGSNNSKLSPANNIAKVANRHRRDGSGSSVHNSKAPQLHIQGAYSSPQTPALQTSRSKDTLSVYLPSTTNGNRNSLYINNNNIQKKLSSEQLKTNRNSTYSQHKHRIRS